MTDGERTAEFLGHAENGQNASVDARVAALEGELAGRNAELEASLSAAEDVRERLGAALARIEALGLERDELKIRRDELESRVTALERIAAGHAAALEAAQRAAEAAEKRATAVRALARAAADDAVAVAARLREAERERAHFEKIADDERARVATLEQHVRAGGSDGRASAERRAAIAEATAREKTLESELNIVAASFVEYAEAELDRLRRESALVDAAIRATRASGFWGVKARINRVLSVAKRVVRRAKSESA